MACSRWIVVPFLVITALSMSPGRASVNRAPSGDEVRIAVLGDSLAAGYGLSAEASFPGKLEAALAARGIPARVLNHGVSGDTSAGGRQRVGWMLQDRPDLVIVELGANDALRGLSPEAMEQNLSAILDQLERSGVGALLAGMRAPPNLGREYGERFEAVFPRLARLHGVPHYPFFLEGVAGVPRLNQADGIHPNPAGVERIVEGILPLVVTAVTERAGASGSR